MLVEIVTFKEFAQRHGDDQIKINNRLVWSDGASCDIDLGSMRTEPPADPLTRLSVQKKYWTEREERATEKFNKVKSLCSEQATLAYKYRNLPAPDETSVAELKDLKNRVVKCRLSLAKIEKELEALGNDNPSHVAAQLEQDRRSEISAIASGINSITL